MKFVGILLILLCSLVFSGIIGMVKAKVGGRQFPSIFQPLFDVARLFKKGVVYSKTTSIIFRIAPMVYFTSILTALLFIPFGQHHGLLSFEGDFVFFAYLLALGKFLMIIGAMDTGSGFEGMGANREALYSMLVEPAFFILMGSLALFTNEISFHGLFLHLHLNSHLSYLIAIIAIYVLIHITMVENSRLPVDDPKTHLELTMVHEVMVLDHSGFDLAIIQVASWLKFTMYGALIANFITPISWPGYAQAILFIAIQLVFATTIGLLESFRARNKMAKNAQWIVMLSAIAVLAFLTTLILSNKLILN